MNELIPYMTVLMLASYILVKLVCVTVDEVKQISVRLLALLSMGVVGITIVCTMLALAELLFSFLDLMEVSYGGIY
ncbi:MAG: hypothetical protein DRO67_07495 [Candidatus Asgardarchaeum californiense]|nr:MAG: hypothetical protein DRO67_07495 [Candidatus Asgardarchaeum californiense]